LKDFVTPKGYKKITEAKGDLDKDGIDETVIIFNTPKKIKNNSVENYIREFFILKNIFGKQKIWKQNSTILLPLGYGFYYESDPDPSIQIKNGCLIISQQFNSNSRRTQKYKDTFRFQDNDFYLIGALTTFTSNCEFSTSHEINFSTGKAIANEEFENCYEENAPTEKDFHKEFIHKLKTLIKMNNFVPGDFTFKIPNSNKYFNY